MNKNIKLIITILLIAVVIGVLYGMYMYFNPRDTVDDKKPDIVIQATDLVQKFTADAKSEDLQLKDKIIQVSGTVAKVDTPSTLVFDNGGNYIIAANLLKSDQSVKNGDVVSLKGRYSGYIINDDMFMIPAEIKINEAVLVKK